MKKYRFNFMKLYHYGLRHNGDKKTLDQLLEGGKSLIFEINESLYNKNIQSFDRQFFDEVIETN